MARIRSFTHSPSAGGAHPTEVDATWAIVRDDDEHVLLQISTLGSDRRQSRPKPSQTIQIDHNAALQLVKLIAQSFGPDVLR